MKPRPRLVRLGVLAAFLVVLLSSPPALAYHWAHETPSELLESRAGDPRILGDGDPCFAAVEAVANVTCAVLYPYLLQPFDRWGETMNLVRPADCIEDLARGATADPAVLHADSQAQVAIATHWVRQNDPFGCGDDSLIRGGPALHADLRIDPRVNITAHWYLSADSLEVTPLGLGAGGDDPLPAAGSLPCVTVAMVVTTARPDGAVTELARGETTRSVVSGPVDDPLEAPLADPCPGSDGTLTVENVTEIKIDLGRSGALLEAGQDTLEWKVAWYHEAPTAPDAPKARPVQWNVHTGPSHPPRLVLPTQDALQVSRADAHIHPTDRLRLVHTLESPWGRYDVDRGNIRILLQDEQGAPVELNHLSAPKYGDQGGALLVITSWDVVSENLPPGHYTLTFAAPNWQHTVDANATARVEVTRDGVTIDLPDGQLVVSSPAALAVPAPGLAVLVLLALGLGLRCRGGRARTTGCPAAMRSR